MIMCMSWTLLLLIDCSQWDIGDFGTRTLHRMRRARSHTTVGCAHAHESWYAHAWVSGASSSVTLSLTLALAGVLMSEAH
jgi:hypothetical protein